MRKNVLETLSKEEKRQALIKKEAEEYFAIHHSDKHHVVKKYHKAKHFSKWAIKLLVPDFLVGHPNLWDNLKTLTKQPNFKPLRMALVAWVLFSVTIFSTGIYALVKSPPAKAAGEFVTKTGYYIGNGTTLSISGLGWKPELLLIKADTTAGQLVWKSSAMPDAVVSYLGVATADNTDGEITFDNDGFTVNAALEVNTKNTRYIYVAFDNASCTAASGLCVGKYTGAYTAAVTMKSITGVGFQPELAWVKRTSAVVGSFTTATLAAKNPLYAAYFSAAANDVAGTGTLFRSLDADGFTVGSTNNALGAVYYYVAVNQTAGQFIEGAFTGNGTDSREITTTGLTGTGVDGTAIDFEPDFVLVKQNSAVGPALNTTECWGDNSQAVIAGTAAVNHIQALQDNGFQVGNSTAVNASGVLSLWFAFGGAADPAPTESFLMEKGTYIGDASASRLISVPFAPELVFVKADDSAQLAVWSTLMETDATHYFASATVPFVSGIMSMSATGFTIGNHATVNSGGVNYEWVAFGNSTNPHTGAHANDFFLGYFGGNGLTPRAIDHLGITPDMVLVKPAVITAASNINYWKTSTMTGANETAYFTALANDTGGTLIRSLDSAGGGGFTVGNSANINALLVNTIFFGFKNVAGLFKAGTYDGTGVANEITGLGFNPDYVWVKRNTNSTAVHRSTSAGITGANSQYFSATVNAVNMITGFVNDGFSVGTSANVNSVTAPPAYHYISWNGTYSVNPPTTPTHDAPGAGATGQLLNPTLTGSAYADLDVDAQTNAQWQVDDASDFLTPVWTRTAGAAEITTSVTSGNGTFANALSGKTELDHNTTYYFRVAYSDGNWSNWSTATAFTTNVFTTPTNASPVNGATVTTLTPTLTADAFTDAQGTHTAASAQWQINTTNSFTSPYYDSGTVAYGASFAVPAATLIDRATYYWRVRYLDSGGQWSSWSTATRFVIFESKVSVTPIFGSTVVDQGNSVNVDAQVKLTAGTVINDATVTVDIYSPAGVKIVTGQAMSYVADSNGIYRYSDYSIPAVSGSYLYVVTAVSNSVTGYGAANFEVRTLSADLTSTKGTVEAASNTVVVVPVFGSAVVDQGDDVNIDVQIKRTSGAVINDATVTVDVYSPGAVKLVTDGVMSYVAASKGIYRYSNFEIPAVSGGYLYVVTAVSGAVTGYSAANFEVKTLSADLTSTKGTVEGEATAQAAERLLQGTERTDQAAERISQAAERVLQVAERLAQGTSRTAVTDIQTKVTDIQTKVTTLISEIGTNLISGIKTKTDSIAWGDVTGIVTSTGLIKEKTDTIDWTNVTGIKTKTDSIAWGDVTGIKLKTDDIVWSDITTVKGNVATLITEIGTDRISGIKTATDTISWGDVTGIVTSSGLIQAKTDTIDWANVTGIKTKTDTIDWTNVTGIKLLTDTIDWADVTDIQTKVGDVQTKVTNIQSNMDVLIGAMIVTQGTVNDAAASTTAFVSSLVNTTNNFYKNAVLTFTSGDLDGQSRRISAYDGVTKTITLDPALTSAPANGSAFTIISQNVRVEEQVEAFRSDAIARLASIEGKVDAITTTLNTVDTNLDAITGTINSIRSSQQKGYQVTLSDVSEVQAGNTYRAKVTILDQEANPVDAVSAPSIMIYNAIRGEAQPAVDMTWRSTGVYEYTKELTADSVAGLWESIVTTDMGGTGSIMRNDYWQVTGAPAQVIINRISDWTVDSIAAEVTITNEGGGEFEYKYEWCVVSSEANQCGGGDDVYHGTGAKLIAPGIDFNTTLTATVPNVGDYYFKLVVYYGTASSGSSRTFTATADDASAEPSAPGGSYAPSSPTPLLTAPATLDNVYAEISNTRTQLNANSQKLADTVALLGLLSPSIDKLLAVNNLNTENITDIQNKLADLKAVSSSTRRILEQKSPEPIVETYMKFNSVEIHFLITNPNDTKQTVKFKAFLPAEVKPEHVLELSGLKINYDANAGTYYVYGDIPLDPGESVTKKVEMKDIWVFSKEEVQAIKKQAESLLPAVSGTQYAAQGTILKNEIDSTLAVILSRQEASYSSPQEHIVVYRENQIQMTAVKSNLQNMKDLVVQAGATRGVVGSVGGIQTFATWGIIMAIVLGFGLLAAIIFAMWRHQTMMGAMALGMTTQQVEAHFGGGKKKKAKPAKKTKLVMSEPPCHPGATLPNLSVKKILIWTVAVCGAVALGALAVKFVPAFVATQKTKLESSSVPVEKTTTTTNKPVDAKPFVANGELEKTDTAVVPTTTKPTLKIIETPTGWLNVRDSGFSTGKILGKVYPEEQYEYTAETGGWFQIILKDKTTGWISGAYAQKIQK
jgi:hypothetical protein